MLRARMAPPAPAWMPNMTGIGQRSFAGARAQRGRLDAARSDVTGRSMADGPRRCRASIVRRDAGGPRSCGSVIGRLQGCGRPSTPPMVRLPAAARARRRWIAPGPCSGRQAGPPRNGGPVDGERPTVTSQSPADEGTANEALTRATASPSPTDGRCPRRNAPSRDEGAERTPTDGPGQGRPSQMDGRHQRVRNGSTKDRTRGRRIVPQESVHRPEGSTRWYGCGS